MRLSVSFVIGFLSFFIQSTCFSAAIYVDQSGGGDYESINDAITAAYPGDIVYVGPGVYQEDVVIDTNLELIGSGPKYTFIEASGNGITIGNGLSADISNFSITAGGNGIGLGGDNITTTIRNCIIVGCGGNGINSAYKSNNHTTVINNTIAHNAVNGIYQDAHYSGGVVTIQGNIIIGNGESGLNLDESTERISYNNVWRNFPDYTGCAAGTDDFSQDPLFIDENNGNYALLSNSHCIDTGIPGEAYNDPDGTRNDMGAFSGPPSAAFWPYIPDGPVVTDIDLLPASVPRGGTITIRAKGRVH